MNYCSVCGLDQISLSVPINEDLPRAVCGNCGTIHYVNPKMVVGCIVEYQGKILLAKRGIEPRKDFWNLPCGFLEMNENVEDGATREVYEETGITANIKYLQSVYNVVHSGQVYLIFFATTDKPEFKDSFETIESKFFDPDKIPWDDIAFSSNTFALKKFLEADRNLPQIAHIGSTLS